MMVRMISISTMINQVLKGALKIFPITAFIISLIFTFYGILNFKKGSKF
ncbi:hypothetical protein CM15mP37_05370 [bacterium]|nr:MAG: hypothetical protein CM15mP37_05370 [bacterium]